MSELPSNTEVFRLERLQILWLGLIPRASIINPTHYSTNSKRQSAVQTCYFVPCMLSPDALPVRIEGQATSPGLQGIWFNKKSTPSEARLSLLYF